VSNSESGIYVVSATARVAAPAARVYGIIADYRNGHPRILPPQFTSLTVDKGGFGAGTEIRFTTKVFGRTDAFRATVTEPEPGRVLVETNAGRMKSVTTFTVDPGLRSDESTVTIETTMHGRTGVLGAIERWVSRKVLLRMYADELKRLDQVASAPNPNP